MTAPPVFEGLLRDAEKGQLYLVGGKLRISNGKRWLCEHRDQPSRCGRCNPGSAAAKRKQGIDRKTNDAKGQLAKQLVQLAPGQNYDTDGNVCAGGKLAGQLGKGALKKAIIDLGRTPCA